MFLSTSFVLMALVSVILGLSTNAFANDDLDVFDWLRVEGIDNAVALDWNPDGTSIAVVTSSDPGLTIYGWPGLNEEWSVSIGAVGLPPAGYQVKWSPDGKFVAVYTADVFVVDATTKSTVEAISPLAAPPNTGLELIASWTALDWGKDSSKLALLTDSGYIYLVDIPSGDMQLQVDLASAHSLRTAAWFRYLVFDWSPDGRWFAAPYIQNPEAGDTLSTPIVGVWSTSGQFVNSSVEVNEDSHCATYSTMLFEVSSIIWARDSRTIAVSGPLGYGVCVFRIDQEMHTVVDFQGTLSDATPDTIQGHIENLVFSPNQHWHTVSQGCEAHLARADSGVISDMIAPTELCPNSFSWSPDSSLLAYVGSDSHIWIGTFRNESFGR
jgi:WD40 repeat protein